MFYQRHLVLKIKARPFRSLIVLEIEISIVKFAFILVQIGLIYGECFTHLTGLYILQFNVMPDTLC